MKRQLLLGGFLLIVALLATVTPAAAQLQLNPNNMQFYYYTNLVAKAYVNSQTDTLPSPAATATTVKVGGASFLTFNLVVTDSCKVDVYIDYRIVGNSTWATAVTDSLINTVDAGVTSKEYLLRTQKTDNILEGMLAELRVRLAWRAAGNGVTTPAYIAKFIWKP